MFTRTCGTPMQRNLQRGASRSSVFRRVNATTLDLVSMPEGTNHGQHYMPFDAKGI